MKNVSTLTQLSRVAAAAFLAGGFAASAHALELNISLSEEFQEKIDETYGQREADYLIERLTRDVTRELSGSSLTRVDIVIEDARPNRPTFKELGARPGLSLQSIAIGGADLSASIFDADGGLLTTIEYDWYENDIENAVGSATWTDAKRAMSRFSRKLRDESAGLGG